MSEMPFETTPEPEITQAIEPGEVSLETHAAMKEVDALPAHREAKGGSDAPSEAKSPTQWFVANAKARVDSFNQDQLIQEMREAHVNGAIRIALDLRANRFLSLPVIRFCVDLSHELADDGGSFVLIGCSEKTKRHFEIYGTMDDIRVVRSEVDLDRAKRPRDV